MIKKKGDLFTSDAPVYGHGVNCVGVMGAGIAKTFRERFPKNYGIYRGVCSGDEVDTYGRLTVGGPALLIKENGKWIANLPTQDKPGPDARYDAVFSSTMNAAKRLSRFQTRMAIPMIGCGIGGLEWDSVEHILRTVELLNPGFEFEVWKYDG